jgi:hypothetical protein
MHLTRGFYCRGLLATLLLYNVAHAIDFDISDERTPTWESAAISCEERADISIY